MATAKHLRLRESSVSCQCQDYELDETNFNFQLMSGPEFRSKHQVTHDLVQRLGLEKTLEGHDGCVNCLQWSDNGQILASGSDDRQVFIWDPFRGKPLTSINTGHDGNIFSVKFMPQTKNNLVVSGAADGIVQLHDVEHKRTIETFRKHIYRVKRLEVAPSCPNILWSAGEDGLVMEIDIRAPPNESTVLVNLHAEPGMLEAKCLSINPIYTNYLAVGGSDPYVRMYDRRKLNPTVIKVSFQRSFFIYKIPNVVFIFDLSGLVIQAMNLVQLADPKK